MELNKKFYNNLWCSFKNDIFNDKMEIEDYINIIIVKLKDKDKDISNNANILYNFNFWNKIISQISTNNFEILNQIIIFFNYITESKTLIKFYFSDHIATLFFEKIINNYHYLSNDLINNFLTFINNLFTISNNYLNLNIFWDYIDFIIKNFDNYQKLTLLAFRITDFFILFNDNEFKLFVNWHKFLQLSDFFNNFDKQSFINYSGFINKLLSINIDININSEMLLNFYFYDFYILDILSYILSRNKNSDVFINIIRIISIFFILINENEDYFKIIWSFILDNKIFDNNLDFQNNKLNDNYIYLISTISYNKWEYLDNISNEFIYNLFTYIIKSDYIFSINIEYIKIFVLILCEKNIFNGNKSCFINLANCIFFWINNFDLIDDIYDLWKPLERLFIMLDGTLEFENKLDFTKLKKRNIDDKILKLINKLENLLNN